MTVLLGLLTYIPGLLNLIGTLQKNWFDARVQLYQVRMGTTRDVAIAAINAEVTNNQTKVNWILALAQNPIMMMIVVGFALPWIILEWKVVVYDNVWAHWGEYYTPEIKSNVGDWAGIILTGIFVSGTGIGVAHAFLNRSKE